MNCSSTQQLPELSAYIDFARNYVNPVITEQAGEELVAVGHICVQHGMWNANHEISK